MSPRRVPPDPWPWPGDSTLERSRRMARTYRDLLAKYQPEVCHQADVRAQDLGQGWIVPRPLIYQLDDLITAEQVADMCDVKPSTVDQWHHRGLTVRSTVDGPRYRVSDVLAYHAALRRRRAARGGGGGGVG